MHNFKKLNIWILSMELAKDIYEITRTFPKEEMYGLISQMRRCSVSIPGNIAEATSRSESYYFRYPRSSKNNLYFN